MIRELLQTVGDPEVFFAQQKAHNHPFYNPAAISNGCWDALCSYSGYWNTPVFAKMSFGQTRDFINAVADELGEPSNMPYDKTTDTFYSSTYSPAKEKEIVNHANALLNVQQLVHDYFKQKHIGSQSIDYNVSVCLSMTSGYWQTDNEMETRFRKDTIKRHISLRLKMWVDGKEF